MTCHAPKCLTPRSSLGIASATLIKHVSSSSGLHQSVEQCSVGAVADGFRFAGQVTGCKPGCDVTARLLLQLHVRPLRRRSRRNPPGFLCTVHTQLVELRSPSRRLHYRRKPSNGFSRSLNGCLKPQTCYLLVFSNSANLRSGLRCSRSVPEVALPEKTNK